ncbi:MAG: cytochrome c maturation protein CcmE [Abditibacteriales bacterium]|nr:cytochrome c maturation protein CcmE [Abditibacteriales bacterium]MDW8364688.1 cytochrome c maturation protein CcmE [Abditibacteriales bacterium]
MKPKQQRKLIVGGTIVFGAMTLLVAFAVVGNSMPILKVSDVVAKGSQLYGRPLMVDGKVVAGSIKRYSKPLMVKFSVRDLKNPAVTLPVVYRDAPPDTFKDDATVHLQGVIDQQGVLQADKMLTQCPSKYEKDYERLDKDKKK